MIIIFDSIDSLNRYYAEILSNLDSVNKNINPQVAEKMLKNLLKEYDLNLNLLAKNEKFQTKLLKKSEKMRKKHLMQECKFENKKSRYRLFRRWLNNFKLFRIYKSKFKLELKKEIADDKKEVAKNKQSLKAFYDEIKAIKTKKINATEIKQIEHKE